MEDCSTQLGNVVAGVSAACKQDMIGGAGMGGTFGVAVGVGLIPFTGGTSAALPLATAPLGAAIAYAVSPNCRRSAR
jgi:hypothetical protein